MKVVIKWKIVIFQLHANENFDKIPTHLLHFPKLSITILKIAFKKKLEVCHPKPKGP